MTTEANATNVRSLEHPGRNSGVDHSLRLPRAYEWVSGHLFYHGDLDLLLSTLVGPLLDDMISDGLVRRFFFLRYWEGGGHLRLRLLPSSGGQRLETMALLKERANRFFASFPSADDPNADTYPELADRLAAAEGRTSYERRLCPNNSLRFLPYLRETDRFGDDRSMAVVERHFVDSSKLALRLVQGRCSTTYRDTFGLMAVLTAWFGCEPDTFALRRYLTRNGDAGWRPGGDGSSPDGLDGDDVEVEEAYQRQADRLATLAQRAWTLAAVSADQSTESPELGAGSEPDPGNPETASPSSTGVRAGADTRADARVGARTGAGIGAGAGLGAGTNEEPLAVWMEMIGRLRDSLREIEETSQPRTGPAPSARWHTPGLVPAPASATGARSFGPLGQARVARVIDFCAHLFCNRIGISVAAEHQLRRLAVRTVADMPREMARPAERPGVAHIRPNDQTRPANTPAVANGAATVTGPGTGTSAASAAGAAGAAVSRAGAALDRTTGRVEE